MSPMTLWERALLWIGLRLGWYERVELTPDADGVITISTPGGSTDGK